jgi:muramoyltetrapeptide carboxypeptidase
MRPPLARPRALQPGDRVAIVAPASPFPPEELDAGCAELRRLGFDPVYTDAVFARDGYLAGPPEQRARDLLDAWTDPATAAVIAARGGYGSVQLLPLLNVAAFAEAPKAFIGYSDNTSLMTWLMQACGIVTFHGPMIDRRLARGEAGYDRATFTRSLCRAEPLGEIAPPQLEALAPGEALGELVGGTLTQLVASLGTPFAFDPPAGCVLFLDEVAERPYRLDRMLTQLRLSGLLVRAAAIVFNELPQCEEPGGTPTARDTVRRVLAGFPGPILFGLPSGHTDGPTLTLPFGVMARAVAAGRPRLVIEESAVA